MVLVRARQCLETPEQFLGQPLGQYHCPLCGCMVVAGVEHGPCFYGDCVAADEGWHPGPEIEVDVTQEMIDALGIKAER